MKTMIGIADLPALNASLNLVSALLVTAGFYFVRRKNVRVHRICMLAALVTSTLFLTSYLLYHYNVGSIRFGGQGWVRMVYFPILFSHIVLAAVVLPMVLRTAYLAAHNRFDMHVRIARWTFPTWMYVSVTGVIVYLMLYKM